MRPFLSSAVLLVALFACRAPEPPRSEPTATARPDASIERSIDAGIHPTSADGGADATAADVSRPSSSLARIVIHGAEAFWFDRSGTLFAQKTSVGSKPVPLTRVKHEATALAVDATSAWFMDVDRSGVPVAAELVAVSRADGTSRVAARFPYAETFALAGDSAWVPVTPNRSIGAAEIQRLTLRSGAVTRLAPTAPTTSALLADDASLFTANDEVTRVAMNGGSTKVLGPSPETALDMTFAGEEIVFLGIDPQASTRTLWAYPKKGPPKTPENVTLLYGGASRLSEEEDDVVAFSTDGRRIFYSAISPADGDAPEAKLRSVRRGKSSAQEIARIPSWSGIAISRGRIYWATSSGLSSTAIPP